MGQIQFEVSNPDLLIEHELPRADFVTFDGRVLPTNVTFGDGILQCERDQQDSGRLRLLYQMSESARYVAQTTSLRPTQTPYNLEVELARGALSRLRNHYGMWTGAGLQTTPDVDESMQAAHRAFRQAAVAPGSVDAAIHSLQLAHKATERMCELYTRQRLAFRRQKSSRFPIFLGCRLSQIPQQSDAYLSTFNAVHILTQWKDLESSDGVYEWDAMDRMVDWAMENKLFIMGGPLVDLSSDCFPAWLNPWKGDLINLQSFTSDFVETVVGRYVGMIRHWEVVCGANRGGASDLNEEQRLNLVVQAVEAARQVDEQIQVSLRVVQPWGEYHNNTANRLPPIQFIDTLRRSGVRISEVNLELKFGTTALRSLPRDQLCISQLLDHWSLLQTPLNVMLDLPQSESADQDTQECHASWLLNTLLMCLSKERITGVYCMNWQPSEDSIGTPLTNAAGEKHPALQSLQNLEREHWPS